MLAEQCIQPTDRQQASPAQAVMSVRLSLLYLALLASLFLLLFPLPALADQADDLVLFDTATAEWHIRSLDGSVTTFIFGEPRDLPLWGDWDCDGVDSAGLFRRRTGMVILSGPTVSADAEFEVQLSGDVPLAGDWNGDGCDTVSLYRSDRLLFINELGGEVDDRLFFGLPGDLPLAGDFDGDGVSSIAVFRSTEGRVYLTDNQDLGVVVGEFEYGDRGDYVTVGDWNGDGVETLARFIPDEGTFLLSLENSEDSATDTVVFGEQKWIPPSGRLVGPREAIRGRMLLFLIAASIGLASWGLWAWSNHGSRSEVEPDRPEPQFSP